MAVLLVASVGVESCCRPYGPVMVKREQLYVDCGCGCCCLNSAKNEVTDLYKCAPISVRSGCGSLELWLLGGRHTNVAPDYPQADTYTMCTPELLVDGVFFVLFWWGGGVVRKTITGVGGRRSGSNNPRCLGGFWFEKCCSKSAVCRPGSRETRSIHTSIPFDNLEGGGKISWREIGG